MKKSEEMYNYIVENGYGANLSLWIKKHCGVIEKALAPNERIELCFVGYQNSNGLPEISSCFVYAVSNKRIIIAKKKIIGDILITIKLKNVNDVTKQNKLGYTFINIDSYKESVNIMILKKTADDIYNKLTNALDFNKNSTSISSTTADELLKYKNLLDAGAITQEEYNKKKKELL